MNRLTQQFVHDGHLSFRQKIFLLIMQIFGDEILVDVDDLGDMSHCCVFNEDVYSLNKIEMKHLAWRKLLNPFKWLEFLISVPLELISWAPMRFGFKTETAFFFDWLTVLIQPLTHIPLGLARRILAPARYIIRPLINMAKQEPGSFAILLGLTLIAAGFLASALFTGGLSLAVGGVVLTTTVAAKVGIIVAASAICFSLLRTVKDFFGSILQLITKPKPAFNDVYIGTNFENLIAKKNTLEQNRDAKNNPAPITAHLYFFNMQEKNLYYIKQDNSLDLVKINKPDEFLAWLNKDFYLNPFSKNPANKKPIKLHTTRGAVELNFEQEYQLFEHTKYCPRVGLQTMELPEKVGALDSTDKITQLLHNIEPTCATVKKSSDQSFGDNLALFFGVESLLGGPTHYTPPCKMQPMLSGTMKGYRDTKQAERAAARAAAEAAKAAKALTDATYATRWWEQDDEEKGHRPSPTSSS